MSCVICGGEPIYKVFSTYKTKYVSVPSQYNVCSCCGEGWHSSLRTDFELRHTIMKLEEMINYLQTCGNCKYNWIMNDGGKIFDKELYDNKCRICDNYEKWDSK